MTVPEFTITPSYCTIAYSQSTTLLKDVGSTGVTYDGNDRDFTVFYDSNLDPATGSETQTVTVSAAPTTIYSPMATGTISATVTVVVEYLNPCTTGKITISSTPLEKLEHIVGH